MFENKTYILEPMKNATNRYKLFPAKNLQSVWGSCGSHHNVPHVPVDYVSPAPSQMRDRRVRKKPKLVFLGSWGLEAWTPSAGGLGAVLLLFAGSREREFPPSRSTDIW
jgi:hypothetical protein